MDLIRLKSFPAVAASSVASLATDELAGYSIHGLVFERGGGAFTNAHLAALRVRLNGKDLVSNMSGAQLVDLNEYDGLTDVTNYTTYFFGDPTARTTRGEHIGDLDLSVYRGQLEIEVQIGAATTPTLSVYAIAGVPKLNMGIGFSPQEAAAFKAQIRTVITESAAVNRKQYGISLGSSAGALIRRVNFFHAQLTAVEFRKQSLIKYDNISAALNNAVAQQYARTPQAGLYVLDRIVDGNIGEAEPTIDQAGRPWNLSLALTTANADTITAFADVLTNHRAL